MNINNICDVDCSGCSACSAICPLSAISMEEDEHGFLIPQINNNTCVDCRVCQKTCNQKDDFHDSREVLIAKHMNEKTSLLSQSGGAFTAISDAILSEQGVVYGAVLNSDLELYHMRATTVKERDKMLGSKYIQSHIEKAYNQLEQDLRNGYKVLFSGTPCQVSGILKYLKCKKIDISNLYTVDILCHGVPSVLLWRDLKKYYEKEYKCQIEKMILQETSKSKRPTHCYILNGKTVTDEIHRKLYYSNLALRESCYHCQYTTTKRVGDLTIGDAWGCKQKNPDFFDERGVSLIMINTDKGAQLKNAIKNAMYAEKVELADYEQQCMRRPASPHRSPSGFWNDYNCKNFEYIIQKYAKHNIFLNIRYIFSRLIKAILK